MVAIHFNTAKGKNAVTVAQLLKQGFERIGVSKNGKEVYRKVSEKVQRGAEVLSPRGYEVDTCYAYVKDGVVQNAAYRNVSHDLANKTTDSVFGHGDARGSENPQSYLEQLFKGTMCPDSSSRVLQTPKDMLITSDVRLYRPFHDKYILQTVKVSDGNINNYERTIEKNNNIISSIREKKRAGKSLNFFDKLMLRLFSKDSHNFQAIYYGNNGNYIHGFKHITLESGATKYYRNLDRAIPHNEAPLPRFTSVSEAFEKGKSDL